ncbi:MAG: phosphate ABC transporter substrate-binding protein PstS [Candidatus Margulisbacteria bacterium]|nr:phosphate ABC transporter substrate-binding protein PstS [Candidatus Margulisiibacteriota bacterium]
MNKLFKIFSLFLISLMLSIPTQAVQELQGAGASFPYPLYAKMFEAYYNTKGVKVNYQAIGSGGGIRQINAKTVDFGASDAFLSTDKIKEAPAKLVHIPTCLGAVSLTYNLPGISTQLKFKPDVLADIFLGKIVKWNDQRIAAINPGVNLPNMKISVVHRSDGSGTTAIFTDYLSKVSKEWKNKVGSDSQVKWPTGLGAQKNAGVAGLIKQIPGSIGYVELIYALSNDMPVAAIKNKSGNYITPSLKGTSLAANIKIPADTRVSLTDTNAAEGYPIAGFTWILVYQQQKYDNRAKDQAKTLVDLLWWMTHDGQKYAEPMHYAPLPEAAISKVESIIKAIKYGNKNLL